MQCLGKLARSVNETVLAIINQRPLLAQPGLQHQPKYRSSLSLACISSVHATAELTDTELHATRPKLGILNVISFVYLIQNNNAKYLLLYCLLLINSYSSQIDYYIHQINYYYPLYGKIYIYIYIWYFTAIY